MNGKKSPAEKKSTCWGPHRRWVAETIFIQISDRPPRSSHHRTGASCYEQAAATEVAAALFFSLRFRRHDVTPHGHLSPTQLCSWRHKRLGDLFATVRWPFGFQIFLFARLFYSCTVACKILWLLFYYIIFVTAIEFSAIYNRLSFIDSPFDIPGDKIKTSTQVVNLRPAQRQF